MSDPQQGRQDALDELLGQDDAGGEQAAVEQAAALVQGVSGSSSFDFSRPTKISRQFEKNLITFAEAFAKSSSLGLTSMLRANTGIGFRGLEVMNFGEFVGAMPPVTCAVNIGLAPLNGLSLLHLDAGMVYLMMMRLLGGPIEACRVERKFSDIELGVSRLVIDKLLAHIAEGAEKLVSMQPTFVHLENNPSYITTVTSGEPVLLIRFEIGIDDLKGPLDLCIPLTAFEPVWHRFDPEENSEFRTPEEVRRDRQLLFEVVKGATADVVVNLADVNLTFENVLELKEGDVLPLYKSLQSPLVLEVQGKPMFRGLTGKLNQCRALKLTERLEEEE